MHNLSLIRLTISDLQLKGADETGTRKGRTELSLSCFVFYLELQLSVPSDKKTIYTILITLGRVKYGELFHKPNTAALAIFQLSGTG